MHHHAMPSIDELRAALTKAAASDTATAMRLVSLLWSGCPVDALETAARSEETIERLASARHPRTPAASVPILMREGPEADRLFWLGVAVHVTSGFENGGERGWTHLHATARALAALASTGELVDTPTNAIGPGLVEASSPATPPERLVELGLHHSPLVTALLVPRRDLPETADLAMSLSGSHPVIAEKVAVRTKSPLVLTKLAERTEREDWRVRKAVAGNVHTPVDILTALAARPDFNAFYDLAANPSLPSALALVIASRDEWYPCEELATNPSVTPEALAALFEAPKPPLRQLAGSPRLTPEMAQKLLAYVDDPRKIRDPSVATRGSPRPWPRTHVAPLRSCASSTSAIRREEVSSRRTRAALMISGSATRRSPRPTTRFVGASRRTRRRRARSSSAGAPR